MSKQNLADKNPADEIFLGDLPDDIIGRILELLLVRLNIREVARTSILCKSLNRVWKYLDVLDFDGPKMNIEILDRARYVEAVHRVINSHEAPTIREFRVKYDLDKVHAQDIDSWILFAIRKNVQKLELDLTKSVGYRAARNYTISNDCYNYIKTPQGLSNIKHLKSLCLNDVLISEEILHHFFLNCEFLESLSVKGAANLEHVRIGTAPSSTPLRLKFLDIGRCRPTTDIKIQAPNLVSLLYVGFHMDVQIGNAPHLINLAVGGIHKAPLPPVFTHFSNCLSQIETLQLRFSGEKFKSLKVTQELTKLKHLTVKLIGRSGESAEGLISLIMMSPSLSTLKLESFKYLDKPMGEMGLGPATTLHQCLKVIELGGEIINVDLITCLVENTAVPDKIIVTPRLLKYDPLTERGMRKVRKIREAALDLKSRLPKKIHFVIF